MTTFGLLSFILLGLSVFAKGTDPLPKVWDKDFVITLSFVGARSSAGGPLRITFTYDSCTYSNGPGIHGEKMRTYEMTEKDRKAILKKLHKLNSGKIRVTGKRPVHDGWSQTICFGLHCIDGGPSSDMPEKDKQRFHEAYDYLEEFADKKTQ